MRNPVSFHLYHELATNIVGLFIDVTSLLPFYNAIRCRPINWMVKLASFNKLAKSGLHNIHHK
jgi:hypothetical protein